MIVTKDKQGTRRVEDLVTGIVVRVLSKGRFYQHGVKVKLLPIQSNWTPQQLKDYVRQIQEAANVESLPFAQESDLVVGRIQYFVR